MNTSVDLLSIKLALTKMPTPARVTVTLKRSFTAYAVDEENPFETPALKRYHLDGTTVDYNAPMKNSSFATLNIEGDLVKFMEAEIKRNEDRFECFKREFYEDVVSLYMTCFFFFFFSFRPSPPPPPSFTSLPHTSYINSWMIESQMARKRRMRQAGYHTTLGERL